MRISARYLVLFFVLFTPHIFAGVRVKVDTSLETILEVSTGQIIQRAVQRQGNPYSEIRLRDFDAFSMAGAPEIPSRVVHLLVPHGRDFKIDVFSAEASRTIPLRDDISFAERLPVHDGSGRLAERDPLAYARRYGTQLVEVDEVGFSGSEKILSLRLWPLHYDAAARRLELTTRFNVRIRYVGVAKRAASSSSGLARYLVLNRKVVQVSAPARKVDLIIAHSNYQMDLFRLLEFKVLRGRTVRTHFVDSKSAVEIKALIKQEYESVEPPSQTLIIGSMSQLPGFSGSGDNTWTDYNYQLLDSDSIPDISVGRIPASNSIELRNFVDKVIARELEPRNVENVLITAGKDTSMGCPANVTKVGVNLKQAGSNVQITKKFRTEVSTEEVIAGYNDNPNLIVYDGHGNRDGMTEVPLVISSLNKLSNSSFPIVLDIACLNANWSSMANWRNFTSAILFEERRGVAGIMASGGSGNGHEFFQSIGRIMADARKNLSNDTKMNEIGHVILAAKILHGQQDRAYWNYYGDPASSVWESTY